MEQKEEKESLESKISRLRNLLENYRENLKSADEYRTKLAAGIVSYAKIRPDMLELLLSYLCEMTKSMTTDLVPEIGDRLDRDEFNRAVEHFELASANARVIGELTQDLTERMKTVVKSDIKEQPND